MSTPCELMFTAGTGTAIMPGAGPSTIVTLLGDVPSSSDAAARRAPLAQAAMTRRVAKSFKRLKRSTAFLLRSVGARVMTFSGFEAALAALETGRRGCASAASCG
jgi:hypothetical protein